MSKTQIPFALHIDKPDYLRVIQDVEAFFASNDKQAKLIRDDDRRRAFVYTTLNWDTLSAGLPEIIVGRVEDPASITP